MGLAQMAMLTIRESCTDENGERLDEKGHRLSEALSDRH